MTLQQEDDIIISTDVMMVVTTLLIKEEIKMNRIVEERKKIGAKKSINR